MMRHTLVSLVLALGVLAAPLAAQAADKPAPQGKPQAGIVAVVNDDVISSYDLESRARLAILGSGIPTTPEVIERLRPQILRTLIDERLQQQEAKKQNVTADEAVVREQIAKLAEQNGMSADDLPRFFAAQGVAIKTLQDQIRASVTWATLVQRKLRPQVNVSDMEVDAELARQKANEGKPEFLAAEIFLPVDNPKNDDSVKQAALRLIDQMSKGVRFSAIARQFSQSSTAAKGGDLGWLLPGQIDPDLEAALRKTQPGTLTPPIRTAAGYYILMLREVRQGKGVADTAAQQPAAATPTAGRAPVLETTTGPELLDLRQVLLPLPRSAGTSELQIVAKQVESLRARAHSCTDMEAMATAAGNENKGDLGKVELGSLPPAIQPTLMALADNTPSPAMRNDRGVLFLMICGRGPAKQAVAAAAPQRPTPEPAPAPSATTPKASTDIRAQIMEQLGTQKLELAVRRYLRDLRQNAYIDIRG